MDQKIFHVAVIGCGGISRVHIAALMDMDLSLIHI